MTVEAGGGGIASLNTTYPAGGDGPSEGDNHIRLIKAELQSEFPNFASGIPMTATQAELNTLDGITATTAELNILDGVTATATEINNACDHSAVTGFTLSHPVYIDDDGDSQGANSFNVAAAIGAAWESVGPTGSGATNIWTALDVLPSGAKWVEIGIYLSEVDVGGIPGGQFLYARRNGSTASVGTETVAGFNNSAGATAAGSYATKKIPVTSRKFDLYYSDAGVASPSAVIMLVSFGV